LLSVGNITPLLTSQNIGSTTYYWNNAYLTNVLTTSVKQTAGNTLTIGDNTSTSALIIQSGSGGITVNSGTGTIGISTDASATTLNIGTGGAEKTITVGSTNTTSATAIQSGKGGITFSETIASNIVPITTGTYNLGSASNKFNSLFINNINTTTFNITSIITTEVLSSTNLTVKSTTGYVNILGGSGIKLYSDMTPYAVDSINIGSSSLHYDQMYANSFNTVSDRRLKTNIRPLNRGLNFINAIHPVEFNYINKKKDVYGFIAQDVENELNDVNQSLIKIPDTDDGFYSIEYTQFIPIIIKSIQDLYNIVKLGAVENKTVDNKSYVDDLEIMKNNIELLTSEITKLKKEIKKLQK